MTSAVSAERRTFAGAVAVLSVAVVVEVAAFVAVAVGELNFIVMLHFPKKN